jgi:hypothetical protein
MSGNVEMLVVWDIEIVLSISRRLPEGIKGIDKSAADARAQPRHPATEIRAAG